MREKRENKNKGERENREKREKKREKDAQDQLLSINSQKEKLNIMAEMLEISKRWPPPRGPYTIIDH